VEKAVHHENGPVTFRPVDTKVYGNIGASSMYKIDFNRPDDDPDKKWNSVGVQNEIQVEGIRLDTFMEDNKIEQVDLICMDIQGNELNALKGLGDYLKKVRYVISETSKNSYYKGGCDYMELMRYCKKFGLHYRYSNRYKQRDPLLCRDMNRHDFDVIFSRS
jgi:FkbM family methyltransferase